MLFREPDTEKELLTLISKGDEKAFQSLFSSYYEKLFNYVLSIVKSRQVAEELVMDVFLKIWLGKEIVSRIEKFNAFVFRVAHNKSIDFLRSVARDPKFQDLLWEQIQISNNTYADSTVLVREYEAKLREAVSLLSPQKKKIYQMSREEDMTHDQIAVQLNLSRHTVNNHIVEAQRFIRTYLIKKYDVAFLLPLLFNMITG
ncbi:MAG: RNA polymerase sigma-70 factor [Ginsengibacter sp.]